MDWLLFPITELRNTAFRLLPAAVRRYIEPDSFAGAALSIAVWTAVIAVVVAVLRFTA